MKTLIVDDDMSSRMVLQSMLHPYGESHAVVSGREAVEAVDSALKLGENYDLICLDIMMPDIDGHATLEQIRQLEEEHGILLGKGAKVVMTTALGDSKNFFGAFREQCDWYLVKPIEKPKLIDYLSRSGLIVN